MQVVKNPSDPQSSAQGTAANAPRADEAAVKESSAAEENPTSGPTPTQKENASVEKDHPLDDY